MGVCMGMGMGIGAATARPHVLARVLRLRRHRGARVLRDCTARGG